MAKKPAPQSSLIASNKKAGRDYEILGKHECGIELRGTEVKSIREGRVNISDAFARVEKGQLFLYGCDVQPWETAGKWFQHEAKRPRRLLMHKREIMKLNAAIQQQGMTLVPLELYFSGSRVKVAVGLCRGKKLYDKRDDAAKRDAKRSMDRALRERNR
jgi:SsrA-binding protein